jgi:hypothetical protein
LPAIIRYRIAPKVDEPPGECHFSPSVVTDAAIPARIPSAWQADRAHPRGWIALQRDRPFGVDD